MDNVIDINSWKNRPSPKIIGYRMSFYSEEEIEIALLSLNMYGFDKIRYTRENLKKIEPLFIKRCLIMLYSTNFLSRPAKELINNIVVNLEEIYDERTA